MQTTTIILAITCLISLILTGLLIRLFFKDLRRVFCFFYKPTPKVKHYKKSDYNRAFKYLLNRKPTNNTELNEERLFFLSLINEATQIKQLQTFTGQIKRFYKKKIKTISRREFKKQREDYTHCYKKIVIFLISAITNRFELINEFKTINDYSAFSKLILNANDVSAIDAILIFAEKLNAADYKKLKCLATKKKTILQPQTSFNKKANRRFSFGSAFISTISSGLKYAVVGYSLLICLSLILSLVTPLVVKNANDKLLSLTQELKTKPFIPYFAKLQVHYFIVNDQVYFYKQPDFLKAQLTYYKLDFKNKLCNTAFLKKICQLSR